MEFYLSSDAPWVLINSFLLPRQRDEAEQSSSLLLPQSSSTFAGSLGFSVSLSVEALFCRTRCGDYSYSVFPASRKALTDFTNIFQSVGEKPFLIIFRAYSYINPSPFPNSQKKKIDQRKKVLFCEGEEKPVS